MKRSTMLTITSLLSVILFTLHLTDDIFRGVEPGGLSNVIGGSLDVQGNTGSVKVNLNSIGKTLSCSANTSITGSGNSAPKKTDQCATF